MSDNDRIMGWEDGSSDAMEGKPRATVAPEYVEDPRDYLDGYREGYDDYDESLLTNSQADLLAVLKEDESRCS